MVRSIAVISMVRNDNFFADKWISYYGSQFGYENIYLFIDGMDQDLPKEADKINYFKIPFKPHGRTKSDKARARLISDFALKLFKDYHVVLAMDIDEFLLIDPKIKKSLKAYLEQDFNRNSLSALGVDVAQHPLKEKAIDLNRPFLSQRTYAQVSDRYTKPIIIFKPLRWGSGFHRIKGKNFTIDDSLRLNFHYV